MGDASIRFLDHCAPAAAGSTSRPWRRLRELSAAWVDALGMVRAAGGRRHAVLMALEDDAPARGVSSRQWRRHSALLTYRQQADAVKSMPRGSAIWAGGDD
jgi:hypothetical protein